MLNTVDDFDEAEINIGLFFLNREYFDDEGNEITLKAHVDNVVNKGSTPDCSDSYSSISQAVYAARDIASFDPCALIDLETGELIEEFEVNPVIRA